MTLRVSLRADIASITHDDREFVSWRTCAAFHIDFVSFSHEMLVEQIFIRHNETFQNISIIQYRIEHTDLI